MDRESIGCIFAIVGIFLLLPLSLVLIAAVLAYSSVPAWVWVVFTLYAVASFVVEVLKELARSEK